MHRSTINLTGPESVGKRFGSGCVGWWCADSDDMMSTTYSYAQIHDTVVRSHLFEVGVNVADIVTQMDKLMYHFQ